MKKKKTFVTILLLLGILLLISGIILIYLSGSKTDVSKSDNMSTKIKSLLKNDYIVSNLIYGTPKVKDIPNVTIDNVEYKLVDDDNITGIESLHKIINNTYSDDLFTDSIVDFNKYNKYVEVDTNQDIFEGKSISEQVKIAKQYILDNFCKLKRTDYNNQFFFDSRNYIILV